ncbi:MAG: 4'-phosphopantetheinyl transferase superfamily protein [Chromatocurvus sp.]
MLTVHLRFCCLPAQRDPSRDDALTALLSPLERERCARLPGAHAARAMETRALVRTELATALEVDPATLAFVAGVHGKPAVLDPPHPIAFNLSHSGDWAVLAWHTARCAAPLGVDIEHRGPRERDVMRLARRFFSRPEQAALEAVAGDARDALFYRLWTLKEAWIKAHGLALAPQLGSVAFGFHEAALHVANSSDYATGRLLHGEPATGVWASLCLLGEESRRANLDAQVGRPFDEWSTMSLRGWCGSLA